MDWYEITNTGRAKRQESAAVVAAEPVGAEWVRRKLGFEPDAVQARLLDSVGGRVALDCTRQWGKSTVAAAKAVMEAMTVAGSLTIVASPSARQSGEFMRKARRFLRVLREPVKGDGDNEMSLVLRNGSRIVGLPGNGDTVRGFSGVDLLIVDEAARVEDEMYYAALLPMLATTDGTVWLMSTPNGKQGFFWSAWALEGGIWERVEVRGEDCGRISKKHLAAAKAAMGDRYYRQEYECEFVEAEDRVFREEDIRGAISWEFAPYRVPRMGEI